MWLIDAHCCIQRGRKLQVNQTRRRLAQTQVSTVSFQGVELRVDWWVSFLLHRLLSCWVQRGHLPRSHSLRLVLLFKHCTTSWLAQEWGPLSSAMRHDTHSKDNQKSQVMCIIERNIEDIKSAAVKSSRERKTRAFLHFNCFYEQKADTGATSLLLNWLHAAACSPEARPVCAASPPLRRLSAAIFRKTTSLFWNVSNDRITLKVPQWGRYDGTAVCVTQDVRVGRERLNYDIWSNTRRWNPPSDKHAASWYQPAECVRKHGGKEKPFFSPPCRERTRAPKCTCIYSLSFREPAGRSARSLFMPCFVT